MNGDYQWSEKFGLKLNIQKTKIMASGPITSWQIDGETMETVRDFIFLGSKLTANGDCSHEIKRRLLLGRKVMTNLDSIFKSRDISSDFTVGSAGLGRPSLQFAVQRPALYSVHSTLSPQCTVTIKK